MLDPELRWERKLRRLPFDLGFGEAVAVLAEAFVRWRGGVMVRLLLLLDGDVEV